MKLSVRIKHIYQCSLEDQFKDMGTERHALVVWNAATVDQRVGAEPVQPN